MFHRTKKIFLLIYYIISWVIENMLYLCFKNIKCYFFIHEKVWYNMEQN